MRRGKRFEEKEGFVFCAEGKGKRKNDHAIATQRQR